MASEERSIATPVRRRSARDADRARRFTVVALALLLGLLAALQWRWIGEVSRLERDRTRSALEAAGERLASDLDRELLRVLLYLHPRPRSPFGPPASDRSLADRLEALRRDARFPGLVREVYLFDPTGGVVPSGAGDGAAGGGGTGLARFDPASGEMAAVATWPAVLAGAREPLSRGLRHFAIEPGAPALLLPVEPLGRADLDRRPDGRALVVLLDQEYLTSDVLPRLVDAEFGRRRGGLLIGILGHSGFLYRSDPSAPEALYTGADLSVPLLGLRGPLDLRELMPDPHVGRMGFHGPFLHRLLAFDGSTGALGAWTLVVSHRAGSLEAALARVRWHNLAIGLGILLLLGVTLLVLARSAARARRLADQRLELVAGVTHELHTPLAAMRAAAQNLADGVIVEPERVKTYGALIEREGARLSSLVAQSLELAGIESGARRFALEPIAVGEVVDEALADVRADLEAKGFAIEREIPAALPAVAADRAGLRLALRNLLENAGKHAAAGRFVAVRARAVDQGRAVALTVEDRGPGVPEEDRPHLFSAFFRGRATASALPGAGLGLALAKRAVEAMAGTLTWSPGRAAADSSSGGSAFEIRLAAAKEDAR